MPAKIRLAVLPVLGLVLPLAAGQQAALSPRAESIRATIERISSAETATERQEAVSARIEALGLASSPETFSQAGQPGTNLLIPAIGRGREMLLGAHYDRAKLGRGAIDNASGVAVVLELMAAFKKQPLRTHALAAVLFDLHEVGLYGSKDYVARHADKLPALYVNVETFGYGDTLFGMSAEADSPQAKAVRAAASAAQLAVEVGPLYPATDHLTFLDAKIPSLSFTLAAAEDVRLLKVLLDPTAGRRQQVLPRLLKLIHTAEDTPDKTDPAAIARGVGALESALRKIDQIE
jgi:hypothetical protein